MNWLTDLMGMGNANDAMKRVDRSGWNYTAGQSNYGGPNNYLTGAMGNLNTQAGAINTQAQNVIGQGNQFLDPNSQYYKTQRGFLGRDIADQVSNANIQTQQMLAAKGVGSGAIRSALANSQTNRIGEQVNKGVNSLYQQGIGQGTSLLGMGIQGMNSAGNMYGQVGQLGAGIDQRGLQESMFNTGQANQAAQYAAQGNRDWSNMQYNHAAAQDANAAALWGGALGLAGSLWGK
tara:strand:+ start:13841 stop:14542 length:702 start_codon:yes stop_codon:yes gene_type:complete